MQHAFRRALRCVLAVFVLSSVVVACGDDDGGGTGQAQPDSTTTTTTPAVGSSPGEEAEPEYGGTIIVGLEGETTNWLPSVGQFASSGVTVAMAIYDPLVVQNAEGELEPNLAESIEPNDDLTEWTLTLRPDVRFHDGSVLDADTLKWNFDQLHNSEASNTKGIATAAGLVGVDVVDDLTVVYRLSAPNASFPDSLRTALGWPTSREAYEAVGADALGEAPVGTGPFVFSEWRREERFVVTRNDDYWRTDEEGRELPFLNGVEFRPIADEQSRVQSLSADTVQVVSTLRGSSIKSIFELEEAGGFGGNLHVGNVSGASIFNVLVPPVDDVRIRRGLAFASDADQVAAVLGDDGLVPITTQFVSEDSPWYSSSVAEAYPGGSGRDLAAAQELIEDYRSDPARSDGRPAGDPIEITYTCPPDPSLIEIGQLLQQLWGEAGVVVNLEQVEQATMIGNALGAADQNPPWSGTLMVNCWRAGIESDPLTTLQGFFGPVAETPLNFTNFTHPDIDAALDVLKAETSFSARYAAVEQIGLLAAEWVPIAWGVGTASYVAWRDDIHGIATWRMPSGKLGSGTYDGRVILHQAWMTQP